MRGMQTDAKMKNTPTKMNIILSLPLRRAFSCISSSIVNLSILPDYDNVGKLKQNGNFTLIEKTLSPDLSTTL